MFPFSCWGWYFRIILTPVYFSNQIFTICINNRWLSDFWCWSNSNILVFSGCTVPSDNKEIQLGGSSQEASPSAGKNTGVVLVPCGTWNCVLTAVSGGVDICKVTGCHSLQLSSQWLPQFFFFFLRIGVSWTRSLPLSFLSISWLNKLWPYYQKDVNHVTLNSITL